MNDNRLELTLEEYFKLESHDVKKREVEDKMTIARLQIELSRRDVTILQYRIKDEAKKQEDHKEMLQQHAVAIKNIETNKSKVSSEIEEKYNLPEDWGYHSDTLEIIIGD